MHTLSLRLNGKIPSKKNSKQIITVHGRAMIIPNKIFKDWHEQALWEIKGHFNRARCGKVSKITIGFTFADRRPRDLTNGAESVLDLLVDTGIIEDDKWECVPRVELVSHGVDKQNPHAKVTIEYEEIGHAGKKPLI